MSVFPPLNFEIGEGRRKPLKVSWISHYQIKLNVTANNECIFHFVKLFPFLFNFVEFLFKNPSKSWGRFCFYVTFNAFHFYLPIHSLKETSFSLIYLFIYFSWNVLSKYFFWNKIELWKWFSFCFKYFYQFLFKHTCVHMMLNFQILHV